MMINKTYTLEEAKIKLEQFCVYQERCHQEVIKKLQLMHMIPEAIDVIVTHLIEHRFLNEERFSKAFVRGKFNIKHWGRIKLRLELKRRHISDYNITKALAEISEEEYQKVFYDLVKKKVSTLKEANIYKNRNTFVNYFLYRGWESELVYEASRNFIS